MNATIAARITTQRAEDLRILANQAERAGVSVLATYDDESFAHDPSDPTRLHRLTLNGCSCLHHLCFGRCRHHALLLSELGLIEDTDTACVPSWEPDTELPMVEPMLITLADSLAAVAAA